jgi:hypothetical protein
MRTIDCAVSLATVARAKRPINTAKPAIKANSHHMTAPERKTSSTQIVAPSCAIPLSTLAKIAVASRQAEIWERSLSSLMMIWSGPRD